MAGTIDTVRIKNKIKDILYMLKILDFVTGTMDLLKRYQRTFRMRWNKFKNVYLNKRFDLDPYKVIEIDPNCIKKYMRRDEYFDIWRCSGKVLDGDWDLTENDFENHPIYYSLRSFLVGDKKWEDTEYFVLLKTKFEREERGRNHKEKSINERAQKRGELYKKLYQSMKEEGYKTQGELAQKRPIDGFFRRRQEVNSEITVNIGREGEFILNDGRHRFACAKLLNLDKIPVRILVRHNRWQSFREELKEFIDEELEGKTSYPIPHLDLDTIPNRVDPSPILETVEKNMNSRSNKVLDITSTIDGFFLHEFKRKGYEVYGVFSHKRSKYFLERLAKIYKMRFKILLDKRVIDHQLEEKFDTVLCLNLVDRYLKSKERYTFFLEMIEDLEMDEMFIRLDSSINEKSDLGSKEISKEDIINHITKRSCLKNYERLKTDREEAATLFRLRR